MQGLVEYQNKHPLIMYLGVVVFTRNCVNQCGGYGGGYDGGYGGGIVVVIVAIMVVVMIMVMVVVDVVDRLLVCGVGYVVY